MVRLRGSLALAALLVAVYFASFITAVTISSPPANGLPTSEQLEILKRVTPSLKNYSLYLFSKLCDRNTTAGRDFSFSPISIWSLLLLIAEGETGSTLTELQALALGYIGDKNTQYQAYQIIQNTLNTRTSSVEILTWQALLYNTHMPINYKFTNILRQNYNQANLIPVDFTNPTRAAAIIDDKVRRATNDHIHSLLKNQNLNFTQLMPLSTIYFKGQWRFSFNKNISQEEYFYDEDDNEIAKVTMMIDKSRAVTLNNDLKSYVVQLPYGLDDRFSMMLFLPISGTSVKEVVKKLSTVGMERIMLSMSANSYKEVRLPKFSEWTRFHAAGMFKETSIKDIFAEGNLRKIHPTISVSKLQQDTKIVVNEEGRLSLGTNRFVHSEALIFNRPFAYMIVDGKTDLLLFCGQVMNPTYKP